MKTKELIAELQKIDPTGENEVCVENKDIHFVEAMEAYCDGRLQRLIRDPDENYYNVIGGKVIAQGSKIKINTKRFLLLDIARKDSLIELVITFLEGILLLSYMINILLSNLKYFFPYQFSTLDIMSFNFYLIIKCILS